MPIRPRDKVEADRIDAILTTFHENVRLLPGIQDPLRRSTFLDQLFDSIHRIQFISQGVLNRGGLPRSLSEDRANPASDLFDPVRAAALRASQGEHDEACWFVFLFAHFGKNLRTGYQLTRDVYGSLGNGHVWDWARTSANPQVFCRWLTANLDTLKNDGVARYFGNHRKYEGLAPNSRGRRGTANTVTTYIAWVSAFRNHEARFDDAAQESDFDPRRTFHHLYRSMRSVESFGRTARFDYLTMVGKLGLAEIEPGSTYMTGATGPLAGAKLLFGANANGEQPATLDSWLIDLESALGLRMGMQILEDALCNWQKNPTRYLPFRG